MVQYVAALAVCASLIVSIPHTVALRLSDVPDNCQNKCSNTVSLLNGCGLATDGSNVNSDNRRCFCDGSNDAGYNSCSLCIEGTPSGMLKRDLISSLLDINSLVCDVDNTVNAAGEAVNTILNGPTPGPHTRVYTTTITRGTVTETQTVTLGPTQSSGSKTSMSLSFMPVFASLSIGLVAAVMAFAA